MKRILTIFLLAAATVCHAQQSPMRLWYDRPAQYFEESLPIGNGRLGALVYGGADTCIVHLNDITLWTGKPVDKDMDRDAHQWLPRIRQALFREDYAAADSLQLHLEGPNSQFYQPLGTLYIIDHNAGPVSAYRRQLSLDSALVADRYVRTPAAPRSAALRSAALTVRGDSVATPTTREYLASAPDRLIAIRLRGDINCSLVLTAQVPHKVKASNTQLTMNGHATGDPQESIHFCTMLRVETDGQVTAADSSLTIANGHEAVVYIVNETSFNGYDKHPVREGAPHLERAADAIWHTTNVTYDQVRQRHVADYQHFYNRVKLRLGAPADAAPHSVSAFSADKAPTTDRLLTTYGSDPAHDRYLETLYFQYGRYLLISCSRTKGVPANLQGLWTPYLWSPWRGNYTTNINLEENYWPAFVANLAEMAEPLDDFLRALADNGRHTARNYYGVQHGWCASHNSDLWAMTNPVGEKRESPMWACWNMGGAWLVQTLWERYLFTLDQQYLRDVALPLMKGAADFCLDWLIEHNGELITAPSTSPENEYITDQGYHGVTCYGGTADLAIIRELLTDVIAAASASAAASAASSPAPTVGGDSVATYKSALASLHPYTIGRDGDLNEWYHDWRDRDPRHRHQSHLIGLYPGHHLTQPELRRAAEQTLVQKGDETTGWSTGWRINLWARLKNATQAYHIYRKLLTFTDAQDDQRPGTRHGGGTYANLMDAHPPFQIDGNFGGTAGVCEMLMQSTVTLHPSPATTIELLPALPPEWAEGQVSGLCARGGFEVSFKWKMGKVRDATLTSRKGGTVTLLYNGQQKTFRMKAGQTMPVKTW